MFWLCGPLLAPPHRALTRLPPAQELQQAAAAPHVFVLPPSYE